MKRPWLNTDQQDRPWIEKKSKFGKLSEQHRFYNSRTWMNFRAMYWANHPRECQYKYPDGHLCGKFANILDHIVPLQDGGAPLSESNMQGLCYRHHQVKHNKQRNEVQRKQDS